MNVEDFRDNLTAAAAVASVIVGLIILRIERSRDKRRPIVVETRLQAVETHPGWQAAIITIRNLEPVGVTLLEFTISAEGATLLDPDDAYNPSPFSSRGDLKPQLPLGSERLPFRREIAPQGVLSGNVASGTAFQVQVFVHGPCRVAQVHAVWRWSDGQR